MPAIDVGLVHASGTGSACQRDNAAERRRGRRVEEGTHRSRIGRVDTVGDVDHQGLEACRV